MQVATPIIYPDSDGKRMAENTKQARWIVIFFGNLCALYRAAVDVFVAADNLWYPKEGDNTLCLAPDVYVVFGRPKGDRGSYKQWKEGGIPITVVFEIYSPGNNWREMADKLAFYDEHGVEEYYIYDPEADELLVYIRGRAALRRAHFTGTFTSPRLGIRFDLTGEEMRVFHPNGEPFLSFEDLKELQERGAKELAEEKLFRQHAERRAATAETRLARLVELGRMARQGLATAEELRELERLEGEQASA